VSRKRSEPAPLSTLVGIRVGYQRSVSVENLQSIERVLDGYIPTDRAMDMIVRMIEASRHRPQVRAWSVTGPYGSGKSSFLAMASALFGNRTTDPVANATAALRETTPAIEAELDMCRARAGVGDRGYILAMATAGLEPANKAVSRALLHGAESFWTGRGRKPSVFHKVKALALSDRPEAVEILKAFVDLEAFAPVVLAIDEFGKVLEFSADEPTIGDLYVLQLLAEHVNASNSSASCLVTLQHLAMSDYSPVAAGQQRKEWIKVQGRFQEIAFSNSPDQASAFIRGHLRRITPPGDFDAAVSAWASAVRQRSSELDLPAMRASCGRAEASYPLHPLAAALAPALSQRYNQGDRSLHTWLASTEPASVSRFLDTAAWATGLPLPVYGLDELYDYFLSGPAAHSRLSVRDARLREVLDRVSEATAFDVLDLYLLKTVGLLNLVGAASALAATPEVLAFAVGAQGLGDKCAAESALAGLLDSGFIVYRNHADEYRIWQGSDTDIEDCIAHARERLAGVDLLKELNRMSPASARVAQRHGHKTGTFRYFKTVYSPAVSDAADPCLMSDDADGLLILTFSGGRSRAIPASETSDGRPVVVCQSPDKKAVQRALVETVALSEVSTDPQVLADPVARREIRERLAESAEVLASELRHAFDPDREDLRWFALGASVQVSGLRELSSLLSDVSDQAYRSAIPLHNEVLNRVQLSSQGAKARRELLAHMIDHAQSPAMAIEGFGPERSMYESFFSALKLHVAGPDSQWRLIEPAQDSGLAASWSEIDRFMNSTADHRRTLDVLYESLSRPPFGTREPVLPLLVMTYLAIHTEDVALYQDGSFEPSLTAPLTERLIKAPERFAVRKIGRGGLREQVALKMVERFGSGSRGASTRNATLLQALRPVFSVVRGLCDYSMYTTRVSKSARAVRAAVTSAQELDELLFVDLPRAVGLPTFKINNKPDEAAAERFVEKLAEAVVELSDAYENLLFGIEERVAGLFNVRPGAGVRTNLRERARRLDGHVIDRRLAAFIVYAVDGNLSDRAWLEATCMSLSDKTPSNWRDADCEIFDLRLRELAGLFARVEHLCSAVDSTAGAEGFLARRIALTRPDGVELSRVVWADESEMQALQREVQDIKKRALALGGHGRLAALLAVLADEVLAEDKSELPALSAVKSEGEPDAERSHG